PDLAFCGPSAVGLAIFFAPLRGGGEDPLIDALAECDNLVMPVLVSADSIGLRISHESCYDTEVAPKGGFGAVNIQGSERERDCVREFRKEFQTADGSIGSLPAAMVAVGFPDAARRLAGRKRLTEEIDYASKEFEVVYPDEILDNQELIDGRLVFVGKLQDRADLHITPLHNYTPGLMVHAYTAATILNGDYIRRLSEWEGVMLGALFCFLVVWINLHLMASVMGPLLVRSLQLGLLYFMILTGTMVYIHLRVDLNFSYSMLTVSLGVAACEIYGAAFDPDGLIDFIADKIKKLRHIIHEKRNHEECCVGDDVAGDDDAPCVERGTEDLQDKGRGDCQDLRRHQEGGEEADGCGDGCAEYSAKRRCIDPGHER
ncbi:MAG: CHASE2 domain-containing protein, partial [Muribaculaceae bacterium]|nr:CHASE2 domain-containing protein [Muribaculaceae bacterium]